MSKEGGGTEETAADQVHWASEFALAVLNRSLAVRMLSN